MLVKDLMSEKIYSLKSDDTVSKFISLLEKYHIHEVPIIDNKKLVGMVNSRRLIEKSITDPAKMKIKSLMLFPPATLKTGQDFEDAANLLFKTGLRALPVVDEDKVVGIVSIHDIVEKLAKTKQFRQTRANQVMSEIFTINDSFDIGTARVLMRNNNISRIPVVDKKGELTGIITVFDMLKSIKKRERMGWYSMAGEMDRIMQIPISTVMNRHPVSSGLDTSLTDIIDKMLKMNISSVIITENKIPKGVIVLKDLLEFYIGGLKKKGVYYQIIGLTDEDDFIVSTVDRMVEETVRKVSSTYKTDFIFLHVKKHEAEGRTKYSIRVRLRTDKDIFISKAWSWDLRSAVDEALTHLERTIFKKKKNIKDRVKRNILKRKAGRR